MSRTPQREAVQDPCDIDGELRLSSTSTTGAAELVT